MTNDNTNSNKEYGPEITVPSRKTNITDDKLATMKHNIMNFQLENLKGGIKRKKVTNRAKLMIENDRRDNVMGNTLPAMDAYILQYEQSNKAKPIINSSGEITMARQLNNSAHTTVKEEQAEHIEHTNNSTKDDIYADIFIDNKESYKPETESGQPIQVKKRTIISRKRNKDASILDIIDIYKELKSTESTETIETIVDMPLDIDLIGDGGFLDTGSISTKKGNENKNDLGEAMAKLFGEEFEI